MEPSPTVPQVDLTAVTADRPAIPLRGRRLGHIVGSLTVGVLTGLAVLLALLAAFLQPPLLHPTLLPRLALAYGLAFVGNLVITLYADRAGPVRLTGLAPALAWLATVGYLASGRPEGDTLYLLQTYQGLLLLPTGMLGAAIGLSRAGRSPRPSGQGGARPADK
jgi:predicted MFS family arabinose efflux permease